MNIRARIALERVPLVRAPPWAGQPCGGWVAGILYPHVGRLNCRMLAKVRADQPTVPGPVVFGVRRRVNADETFAAADEPLERCLLRLVEHIPGRAQENHHVV